jgi:prepilin signal peptidase PulO-like enzyme (type II secretory pathway)
VTLQLVLLVLFIAAVWDARTGRVPDWLMAAGAIMALVGGFYTAPWQQTLENLVWALAVGGGLWLLNELWYRWQKRDGFGMGDVKWTMLCVLGFGPVIALAVWPIGAVLALLWLGVARALGRPLQHVHFVPFLCAALIVLLVVLVNLGAATI